MDFQTLLGLRQTCAGGAHAANRLANSALKSLRHLETAGTPDDWNIRIDLTNTHELPILPWQYATEKGPNGQWAGQFVHWDWRIFLASISPEHYTDIFEDKGIREFLFRALPFESPYPALAGRPHFEFTAIREDGIQVGLHPLAKRASWSRPC